MIRREYVEIARAYHLLSDLEPQFVARLLPIARDAIFNRDDVIFREGAASKSLYLIVAGSVALETMIDGRPSHVQTLNAGDAMGWSAFFESSKTHFQARAMTQVSAIAFGGGDLRAACDDDARLGYALATQLLSLVTDRLDTLRMQLTEARSRRAS
ncbi:MAG: cyclic nucleotide-binding domain-containing protein [Acidobacteriia bacterium]|nr:cyclic nucleotide-binding domain-containing protein [Terriglobia bacterium]